MWYIEVLPQNYCDLIDEHVAFSDDGKVRITSARVRWTGMMCGCGDVFVVG